MFLLDINLLGGKMVVLTYFLFAINPFFSLIFIVLGIIKDRKNSVHYSFLLAGVFAFLAYWVKPRFEMDLTRYFEQVDNLRGVNWEFFVQTILFEDFLFIKNLLFYAISRTESNNLLPTIVIWISYFIMIYILTDYAKKKNVSKVELLFALFFLLSVMPFISLVSNVRNILAFSLITLAVYREFIQQKKGLVTYILYISPLFIHISSLALIALKLLAQSHSKRILTKLFLILSFILLSYILFTNPNFLINLPYIGFYVSSFIDKADIYITDSGALEYIKYLESNTFSKIQKLYFISLAIFLLILLFKIDTINKQIYHYCKYICLVIIACSPLALPVYFRFSMVIIMLSFIIIFEIKYIKNILLQKLIYFILMCFMLIGLIQQIYFFNYLASISSAFMNMIYRSIVVIFY